MTKIDRKLFRAGVVVLCGIAEDLIIVRNCLQGFQQPNDQAKLENLAAFIEALTGGGEKDAEEEK